MVELRLDAGMSMTEIAARIATVRGQVHSQCDDVTIYWGSLPGIGQQTVDAGNILSVVANRIGVDAADRRQAFRDLINEFSAMGIDLRRMDQAIEVDQYRPNPTPITGCTNNRDLTS